jgi:hypothetical protein
MATLHLTAREYNALRVRTALRTKPRHINPGRTTGEAGALIPRSTSPVDRSTARRLAHRAVHRAIRTGTLAMQPCETCGISPADAHHPDYSRPLTVRWLCSVHHDAAHGRRSEVPRAGVRRGGRPRVHASRRQAQAAAARAYRARQQAR